MILIVFYLSGLHLQISCEYEVCVVNMVSVCVCVRGERKRNVHLNKILICSLIMKWACYSLISFRMTCQQSVHFSYKSQGKFSINLTFFSEVSFSYILAVNPRFLKFRLVLTVNTYIPHCMPNWVFFNHFLLRPQLYCRQGLAIRVLDVWESPSSSIASIVGFREIKVTAASK